MSTTPSPIYIRPVRQIIGVSTAGSSNNGTFNPNANPVPALGPGAIQNVVATQTTTLIADAVVEEVHDDQLTITEHPVEQGAVIADHAYKNPAQLDLVYSWSGGSPQNKDSGSADPMAFLKGIYQQFLGLAIGRVLCQVYTGKRLYSNMLPQIIGVTTDKETENVLTLRVRFREILTATTQTTSLSPQANQALPQLTSSPINVGTQNLTPAPSLSTP